MASKERFAQAVKAGFPVNPASGVGIAAENFNRLKLGMSMFKWADPRFVSLLEAERNGWSVAPDVESVTTLVHEPGATTYEEVKLFNARDVVEGRPGIVRNPQKIDVTT